MAAVEALELYKRYRGIPAIDGLDLTVEQEEVYAVCGDPGAGKSTLLSILAGLLYPDAGSVEILGVDPVSYTHLDVYKRQLPYHRGV